MFLNYVPNACAFPRPVAASPGEITKLRRGEIVPQGRWRLPGRDVSFWPIASDIALQYNVRSWRYCESGGSALETLKWT